MRDEDISSSAALDNEGVFRIEHKFYSHLKSVQNGDMNDEQRELDRQKSCLEKLTWETEEAARAAAAYAEWQHGEAKPVPYRCKYCNKWHLARG